MSSSVICPMCGKSDRTAKVSTVYLAGIEQRYHVRRRMIGENELPETQDFSDWQELGAGELVNLVKLLAPPQGKRPPLVQPLHPDMMVVALMLVMPLFVYGMATSQPGMLWVVVPVLLIFYGWYLWKRRILVAKYRASIEEQKQADARVRRGIDRWMRLYYCARDRVTFSAAGKDVTPLDQLGDYLRQG
jgi:hypothetical protein